MNESRRPLMTVVSPHPDDAAFSVSQTLRGAIAAGWDVCVVTVCARSAFAPFGPDGDIDAVSALRAAEDAAFVSRLGPRARLVNLRRNDAPLRLDLPSDADPIAASPLNAASIAERDALSALLPQALADADFVLLPLGLGRHVDHIVSRDAARMSLQGSAAHAFYEDLPYATMMSVVEVLDEVAAIALELGVALCSARAPLIDALVRYRDCRTYATQIDSEGAWALTAYLGRHKGAERLWLDSHADRALPAFLRKA